MAFRQSRPVMGNPLIPLWNDMRALQVLTRLETMQKNGGQISPLGEKICAMTPSRWFNYMKMTPGKTWLCVGLWMALAGGWGIEFLKNMNVMTSEKPPIDWNNEKLGFMKRA
eukprot:CAMPEP_0174285324 /NCGR_PEP_ID=MMETSP0809-20121228/8189_1 /TAXON_ID=73025 ORGANISM="Eutreptiella gymnastica-like, Strain CCMP1594" /NCGR_SAMPLE_ID=MMETSP0809 /ASSEMBLY_ACC=CAM_ASM_000658 /LENGTH=111 /DNA_ID=CAMNT_0015381055 /DNA_START=19 /DNA_END=354 /DNA_ORIENTATION=-